MKEKVATNIPCPSRNRPVANSQSRVLKGVEGRSKEREIKHEVREKQFVQKQSGTNIFFSGDPCECGGGRDILSASLVDGRSRERKKGGGDRDRFIAPVPH